MKKSDMKNEALTWIKVYSDLLEAMDTVQTKTVYFDKLCGVLALAEGLGLISEKERDLEFKTALDKVYA